MKPTLSDPYRTPAIPIVYPQPRNWGPVKRAGIVGSMGIPVLALPTTMLMCGVGFAHTIRGLAIYLASVFFTESVVRTELKRLNKSPAYYWFLGMWWPFVLLWGFFNGGRKIYHGIKDYILNGQD